MCVTAAAAGAAAPAPSARRCPSQAEGILARGFSIFRLEIKADQTVLFVFIVVWLSSCVDCDCESFYSSLCESFSAILLYVRL